MELQLIELLRRIAGARICFAEPESSYEEQLQSLPHDEHPRIGAIEAKPTRIRVRCRRRQGRLDTHGEHAPKIRLATRIRLRPTCAEAGRLREYIHVSRPERGCRSLVRHISPVVHESLQVHAESRLYAQFRTRHWAEVPSKPARTWFQLRQTHAYVG